MSDSAKPAPYSPLAKALEAYYQGEVASFHMPGHKQRSGRYPLADQVLGAQIWHADVSEMGGYDYLHAPQGALVEAQQLAADAFGAGETFFLVGGSTVGNLAAFLAYASDGQHVALLRGSHRSAYAGVVLTGALPHYLPMVRDTARDGWFVADPSAIADLPDSLAMIHITRPNYYGMAVDLAPWRALADRTGAVLVVDEAHGSHFGLHPAFPRSALQEGADIVIQSTHKTLGALTQASMMHVRKGSKVNVDALKRALPMLQSSSPSVVLSLSLDLAAAEIRAEGPTLFNTQLVLTDHVRNAVATIPGLLAYGPEIADGNITDYDPSKLVMDVSGLGLTGFAASAWLREHRKLYVELADHRRIICSLTLGDTQASADFLIESLQALANAPQTERQSLPALDLGIPPQALSPREALAKPMETLPLAQCAGRISAEYIIPYPPGIPLVVPGELIDAQAMQSIEAFMQAGSKMVGPADTSMQLLRVVQLSGN